MLFNAIAVQVYTTHGLSSLQEDSPFFLITIKTQLEMKVIYPVGRDDDRIGRRSPKETTISMSSRTNVRDLKIKHFS